MLLVHGGYTYEYADNEHPFLFKDFDEMNSGSSEIPESLDCFRHPLIKKNDGFYSVGAGELTFNKELFDSEWHLIATKISKICFQDDTVMLLDEDSNLWVGGSDGYIFGLEEKLDDIKNFTKVIDIDGLSTTTKTLLKNNLKDIGISYGASYILLKNNDLYVSGRTKRNWILE